MDVPNFPRFWGRHQGNGDESALNATCTSISQRRRNVWSRTRFDWFSMPVHPNNGRARGVVRYEEAVNEGQLEDRRINLSIISMCS